MILKSELAEDFSEIKLKRKFRVPEKVYANFPKD